jgi:hypothetical protein
VNQICSTCPQPIFCRQAVAPVEDRVWEGERSSKSLLAQPKILTTKYREFPLQRFIDDQLGNVNPVSTPMSPTIRSEEAVPVVRPVRPLRPSKGGWLLPVLIVSGVAFILFVGLVTLVVILCLAKPYGKSIDLSGGSHLYYTSAVTEAEAQKLAQHLNKDFVNKSDHPIDFQLNRTGDRYELRVVVKEGAENDPNVSLFQLYAMIVSHEVFGDAPVDVHLCDRSFKTIRVLPALGK